MNVLNKINSTVKGAAGRVEKWFNEESEQSLIVSIMGQTGVGKSSLINALFGTDLHVDPVMPGTLKPEIRHVKSKSGHDVTLYDLPGLGESQKADVQYFDHYKQMLLESNVVIWATLADSRSFAFDRDALDKALNTVDDDLRVTLMSKIIFVLTKVDLLSTAESSPWIFYHDEHEGVFTIMEPLEKLLKRKEQHFQSAFIEQFKHLLRSKTYWFGRFSIKDPRIYFEKSIVYFKGFLSEEERNRLKNRYPRYRDMFDRLYDQCRVIPCSERFRYNLDFLMKVITDKLETHSVGQFGGFVTNSRMDTVPRSEALNRINIVFVDRSSNHAFNGNGNSNGNELHSN